MSFVYYNPNPIRGQEAGDCTVRAISKAMGHQDWERTYAALCSQGFKLGEMPSANRVWGSYLVENGFEFYPLFSKCKDCYTIKDFCNDHPTGTYVLGTGSHVSCCFMGNVYDAFDSSDMVPTYYFEKVEKEGS